MSRNYVATPKMFLPFYKQWFMQLLSDVCVCWDDVNLYRKWYCTRAMWEYDVRENIYTGRRRRRSWAEWHETRKTYSVRKSIFQFRHHLPPSPRSPCYSIAKIRILHIVSILVWMCSSSACPNTHRKRGVGSRPNEIGMPFICFELVSSFHGPTFFIPSFWTLNSPIDVTPSSHRQHFTCVSIKIQRIFSWNFAFFAHRPSNSGPIKH